MVNDFLTQKAKNQQKCAGFNIITISICLFTANSFSELFFGFVS